MCTPATTDLGRPFGHKPARRVAFCIALSRALLLKLFTKRASSLFCSGVDFHTACRGEHLLEISVTVYRAENEEKTRYVKYVTSHSSHWALVPTPKEEERRTAAGDLQKKKSGYALED